MKSDNFKIKIIILKIINIKGCNQNYAKECKKARYNTPITNISVFSNSNKNF